MGIRMRRLAAAGLILLAGAAGCAPALPARADPALAGATQPTQAALMGRLTTPASPIAPTRTASTAPTDIPAPVQEATEPAAQPTAAPTSTPTVPATPAAFQVCSPIAEVLLADLPRLISDGYHPPPNPRSDARHPAIDIAFYNWKGFQRIAGMPVQAVLAGRIAAAEIDSFPFGNVVIVETEGGHLPLELRQALRLEAGQSLYLLYAHMQEDSLRVQAGGSIGVCETIGRVGKTGNSGAAHLHLETRIGPAGVRFDGFSYYTPAASKTDKEHYRRWATGGEFRHFDPLRLLLWELGYRPTLIPNDNWGD